MLSKYLTDTVPGRLFVYSMMLAFCVACWAGIIHILGGI